MAAPGKVEAEEAFAEKDLNGGQPMTGLPAVVPPASVARPKAPKAPRSGERKKVPKVNGRCQLTDIEARTDRGGFPKYRFRRGLWLLHSFPI